MHRTIRQLALISAIMFVVSAAVRAEEKSKYDELLQAPGTAKTVRSLGLCILALPHEQETMAAQVARMWWVNNPELKMGDSVREIELARLRQQLENVTKAVREHGISKVDLIGFSMVGTMRDLEFYYAAETNIGPIIFRVSVSFRDRAAMIHQFAVFQGFDEARSELSKMTYRASKSVASVTYPGQPTAKPEAEAGR